MDYFFRLNRFDYDSTYTTLADNLIVGINNKTKSETIYGVEKLPSHEIQTGQINRFAMKEYLSSNHKFIMIQRSRKGHQFLIRRMSFTDYPEIEVVGNNFQDPKTLTHTNP